MDNSTLKVVIASSVGGGIGTQIMGTIAPHLWLVGLILGMFLGYISYEFEKVIRAVPEALKSTFSWIIKIEFKKYWEQMIDAILFFSCATVPFCLFLYFLHWINPAKSEGLDYMAFFALIIAPSFFAVIEANKNNFDRDNNTKENALKYNFFAFYFYLVPKYAIKFLVSIPLFVKELFILIHSDERLLCMVDAGIGCTIGHFCGNNALIGAISGGLAGLLHYELVGKRIMELVKIGVIKIK